MSVKIVLRSNNNRCPGKSYLAICIKKYEVRSDKKHITLRKEFQAITNHKMFSIIC